MTTRCRTHTQAQVGDIVDAGRSERPRAPAKPGAPARRACAPSRGRPRRQRWTARALRAAALGRRATRRRFGASRTTCVRCGEFKTSKNIRPKMGSQPAAEIKSGAPRDGTRPSPPPPAGLQFRLLRCTLLFCIEVRARRRLTAFPPRSDARHGRSPGDQPARPRVEQQFAHARAPLAGLPLARAVRAERDEDLFGNRQ